MLPLNDEQRILVEENMGLVGKVIKDCLQNPSAQGCYGRYNSQVCGKHTESAKAGRFRASAMGVMRDLPAVNANETVYRNALILAILLAANSFYHTSAPIARIKVPLFLPFSPI